MKSAETGEPVRVEQLKIGVDGGQLAVDIAVEPLREGSDGRKNSSSSRTARCTS
jgi:hypothetical protein